MAATYGEERYSLRRGGVKRTIENAVVFPWGPYVRKLTVPSGCSVRIYHFKPDLGGYVSRILVTGTHHFGFPPGHNIFQVQLRTAPTVEQTVIWQKE